MKNLKLVMIHSSESGVGYYRIWQPQKFLVNAGVDAFRFTDEAGSLSLTDWANLGRGRDAWITQMLDDPMQIALHKGIAMTHKIPWIVDIDDNIFDVAEHSSSYNHWKPGAIGYATGIGCLENADAVTVSTEQLAKVVRRYNKNVYVLPNCIDPELYNGVNNKTRSNEGRGQRLGWLGGSAHYDDLQLLIPALRQVFLTNPETSLHMSGLLPDFFKEFEANIVYHQPVVIQDYPKHLASMGIDIGLAPLIDRPFNTSKSSIKWMEYSLLGIPTIASAVGPYIGPKNILRAQTKYDWRDHIVTLLESKSYGEKLGVAARAEVLANHTAQANIQKRIDVYHEIINQYKKTNG